MAHDLKTTIAHGLHVAQHTEAGKKAIQTVGTGAFAAATAVFGSGVVAVAAPVALAAALGWALWTAFKD